MHIRKQRLLTPGPTPLLPRALHAMMASDIHHRTQDFIKLYPKVLADLKTVFGTQKSDVLITVSSGTGALEAAISNFFSEGDTIVICCAGKFGERWVELAKAFRLNAVVLMAEYGDVVAPARVEAALQENPLAKGVAFQASETSTGAAHDVQAIAEITARTGALCIVDAITGLGTMPLDIDGWGLDIVVGGSQKAFMIPPGLAFISVSEKAWAQNATAKLPRLYFDLKKEKKMADKGESAWTPNVSLILALAESLDYIKTMGMDKLVENAQLLAKATRAAAAGAVRAERAQRIGHGHTPPEGHGLGRNREGFPHSIRVDHRQRPGHDEGSDLPHRAPRLLRLRRPLRDGRRARTGVALEGHSGGVRQRRRGRATGLRRGCTERLTKTAGAAG